MSTNKTLAIIPARAGSKRIPNKNIKNFSGKPIVAYSIELALNSGLFDVVMVSTDSEKIAEISTNYGAEIPFLRSKKNADDFASTVDVLVEVLEAYKSKKNQFFNIGCCIYPTSPLLTFKNLKRGLDILFDYNLSTTFPVTQFSYPVLRSLKVNEFNNDNEVGRAEMYWPEYYDSRSQDLPKFYHDAGQFYWFYSEKLLEGRKLFTKNSGVIKLSEKEVQDIDNLDDWELAEMKYKMIN